jgi:hypothetical protein
VASDKRVFGERLAALERGGIARERLILDPGNGALPHRSAGGLVTGFGRGRRPHAGIRTSRSGLCLAQVLSGGVTGRPAASEAGPATLAVENLGRASLGVEAPSAMLAEQRDRLGIAGCSFDLLNRRRGQRRALDWRVLGWRNTIRCWPRRRVRSWPRWRGISVSIAVGVSPEIGIRRIRVIIPRIGIVVAPRQRCCTHYGDQHGPPESTTASHHILNLGR